MMYPEDPTREDSYSQNQEHEHGALLSETEFHRQAQLVAQGLLKQVSDGNGGIKSGVDAIRVERALSSARQVIDSIKRARADLHRAHEDSQFELAVIAAAKELPEEYQKQFISHLEKALVSAKPYHS